LGTKPLGVGAGVVSRIVIEDPPPLEEENARNELSVEWHIKPWIASAPLPLPRFSTKEQLPEDAHHPGNPTEQPEEAQGH
jgi:hypothetical protein